MLIHMVVHCDIFCCNKFRMHRQTEHSRKIAKLTYDNISKLNKIVVIIHDNKNKYNSGIQKMMYKIIKYFLRYSFLNI